MNQPHALIVQDVLDALESATCAVGPDGVIVAVNGAWRALAGSNRGDPQRCGVGADYLLALAAASSAGGLLGEASDRSDCADALDVAAGLREVLAGDRGAHRRTYPPHGPDVKRSFTVRIVALPVLGGRGALISHSDVTVLRRTQAALTHQAHHDTLTGLPNRVLLTDRLTAALATTDRRGTLVAVALLDLDHFRRINDSLGHAAGDDLLVQVARRLQDAVREGDTLARYASDEFVAVWVGLASVEQARQLAERCVTALRAPFELSGWAMQVSASVGVAVGAVGQSAEDLLLAADAAMYDVKRGGRGGVRVFHREMRTGLAERLTTELDLRVALERDELVLHYQPVVDLRTGRPVGVEALVRWQHPARGLVAPDQFIPVAEELGMIVPLGSWVLRQACHDAADPGGPLAGLQIAVNLSARQLADPGVVGHVRGALADSGLAPDRLVLEVTESAVVQDERAAALALEELAAIGVGIAVDDFGTGWSSLLYLRRYPVGTLKIDRAFVSGLGRSPDDEAICASVVSLARAVGATCVAEGVETVEQYAQLRGFGCQLGQGFLWSPAVALDEVSAALAASAKVAAGPYVPRRRRRADDDPRSPEAAHRIRALHVEGASLLTIAGALNREAVHHPAGVRWTAATVARHLAS